jgi:hypothetical protein
MPILDSWVLSINVDDVLRAQGADPEAIKIRRSSLVSVTEDALHHAHAFLHPLVLFERYEVGRLVHERLELIPKSFDQLKPSLKGRLITQHLGRSHEVVIIICTIGSELDELVGSIFRTDPLAALALDGVGSAAVENLAIQACNYFEAQANSAGLSTSMPLNPGMIGWPVEQGQPELFTLVDGDQIQVSLNESCMMVPNKSLSMVIGIGKDVSPLGTSCDYCSLNGVCKYQNHYAG